MNTKTEFKSSHRSGSIKSALPKTFGIFAGKHLYWSLFLIKLQAYKTCLLHAYLRVYFPLGKTLKKFDFLKNHVLKNAKFEAMFTGLYLEQTEHIRWSLFAKTVNYMQPLTIFAKGSLVDV